MHGAGSDRPARPESEGSVPGWSCLGGVAGPVVFVTGWLVSGSRLDGYSPVEDAISRLAAVDASTRWIMTAAFVGYAIGLLCFAAGVARLLGSGVSAAAAVNALATVGVALTPLESSVGGAPHTIAATVGYVSLAAMPLLAARSVGDRWGPVRGRISTAIGISVAVCLMATAVFDPWSGFWQRAGLTVGDVWIVAVSVAVWSRGR